VISEGASPRPTPSANALRLVRNAALVCAGAAVIAAVVGVVVGHAGPGGALATGLAIGSINGALAARLIALPIPFLATSLLRIITLSTIGIAIGLAFGLANAQERGFTFIEPGEQVYEGMIVGIQKRPGDMSVNVCKEKKQTNMRSSSADEAIRLIPHRELSLEQAIEFIADDEFVEITPKSIRLRKKVLQANRRPRRWQEIRASQTS